MPNAYLDDVNIKQLETNKHFIFGGPPTVILLTQPYVRTTGQNLCSDFLEFNNILDLEYRNMYSIYMQTV